MLLFCHCRPPAARHSPLTRQCPANSECRRHAVPHLCWLGTSDCILVQFVLNGGAHVCAQLTVPATLLLLLQTIMRSFLGVGAPEAILVAVVALVVFGPKGLADVS